MKVCVCPFLCMLTSTYLRQKGTGDRKLAHIAIASCFSIGHPHPLWSIELKSGHLQKVMVVAGSHFCSLNRWLEKPDSLGKGVNDFRTRGTPWFISVPP